MKPRATGRLPFLLEAAPAMPLLALLLVIAYGTLSGAFFDPQDFRTILMPRSTGWSLSRYFAEGWAFYLPDGALGGFFRPLASLMYIPEFWAFGADPRGYATVDVVTHACCCLALGWLAVRMGLSRTAALLAMLALAVHPRATLAVRMINTRPDVLATLFSLLAAGAALGLRRAGGRIAFLVPAAFCLLAASSKELGLVSLVLVPLFLLGWPGARPGRGTSVKLAISLMAVLAAFVASRLAVLDIVMGYPRYSAPTQALSNAVQLFRNVTGTAWLPGQAVGMAASLFVAGFLCLPVLHARRGALRLSVLVGTGLLLGSQSIINYGPGHYEYGACAALSLLAACSIDELLRSREVPTWILLAFCALVLTPAALLGRRMNSAYAAGTETQRALFEAASEASGDIDPALRWSIVLGGSRDEKIVPWYVHCCQRSEQAVFSFVLPGEAPAPGSGVIRFDGTRLLVEPPPGTDPR